MKKLLFLLLCLGFSALANAQTPLLNSLPSSTYVLMLDADGYTDRSGWWSRNPAMTVAASGYSTAQITELFNRISEDYRPFNINVTTDEAVYAAAAVANRQRVVFTPTDTFYNKNGTNAGGVAYIGLFGGGEVPCWVFTNKMGGSAANAAEAGSHELGHTLTLYHHGKFDASCALTSSYHGGQGSGQTSWGPLMGTGYGRTISLWYKGATSSCNSIQDDLLNITTQNGFNYRIDDVGNTFATASVLSFSGTTASATGIISTTADVDVYRLTAPTARAYSFNLAPYAHNPTSFSGANLDTKLSIRDGAGNLVADLQPLTTLNTTATLFLNAGDYYLTVDGAGVDNYIAIGGVGPVDYGSLGQYSLSVSLPQCGAGIASTTAASRCSTGTLTLAATGAGTLTWYSVAMGGTALATGPSYTTPALSASTTYYVDATNGGCASARVPVNAEIGIPPTLQPINGGTTVQVNATLTLSNSYPGGTWSSSDTAVAKVSGSGLVTGVAPGTVTITYTVQDGTCPAVSVSKSITVTAASTAPQITSTRPGSTCGPGAVTLSATGTTGSTIQWFAAVQGGNVLATGGSFTTPVISATTTYYAQAVNGQQSSSRVAVTATVNPVFTPGTLASGNQTICYSGDPAAIAFATAPAGGQVTYQWYYQDGLVAAPTGSSTTGWTAISGATQSSYDPASGQAASRTFAAFVTPQGGVGGGTPQSGCGQAQWAGGARQVTVLPAFNPGAVTLGDQTFCNSGNPANITLSSNPVGSGAYTWRWYFRETATGNCPTGSTPPTGFVTNSTSPNITGTTQTGAGISFDPQQAGKVNKGRTFGVLITPIANGAVPACGVPAFAANCRKTFVNACMPAPGNSASAFASPNRMEVYPNPVTDHFTVSLQDVETDEVLEAVMVDARGVTVWSQRYESAPSGFTIQSGQLAKGVYQVIVTGKTKIWQARVSK